MNGKYEYLTVKQVAKYLRVSPITMYKMINCGQISGFFKFFGSWRIKESRLEEWLKEAELKEEKRQRALDETRTV